MTPSEEHAYLAGIRAMARKMIQTGLIELYGEKGEDPLKLAGTLASELHDARVAAKLLLEELGEKDPGDLHLADVIEKHIGRAKVLRRATVADMAWDPVPDEPTDEQCSAGAAVPTPDGWLAFATWYPQMGGYVGKAVVVFGATPAKDEACFEVWVWHDGEFPFAEGRRPAQLHHCDPEQFVRFGELVAERIAAAGRITLEAAEDADALAAERREHGATKLALDVERIRVLEGRKP